MHLGTLPNSWFGIEVLQWKQDQSEIDFYVPFGSHHSQYDKHYVHGFLSVSDGTILIAGNYGAEGKWEELHTFEAENEYYPAVGSQWDRALWCIGRDASELETASDILFKRMKNYFGELPFADEEEKQETREKMESCSCSTRFLQDIAYGLIPSETMEHDHIVCKQCLRGLGIQGNEKKKSNSKLYNPDWILEDQFDTIFEIENRANDYVIQCSRIDGLSRLHQSISAMAWNGNLRNTRYTDYDPKQQQALMYVTDDECAGYLSWRQLNGHDMLVQMYVRPAMRRKGIGTQLVEIWDKHLRKTDPYLLDELNDKSRPLFHRIGHLDDTGEKCMEARHLPSLKLQ